MITISSPTPTNNTTIAASASIQFTLTDPDVATFLNCRVEIIATYTTGAVELVYSSAYGGYTPIYAQGSVAPPLNLSLATPVGFIVTRGGGWPANPTLTVSISDTTGQSAKQVWVWALAQVPVQLSASPSNPQSQSPYGSDCRTFAPLQDGTLGVDPYFLLTQDPNIVMTEAIGRILSMPQGALWYAQDQGYDLLNLVNSQSDGDLSGVQASVVQAVGKDPRIQSASCLITPLGSGSYSVNVNGVGAQGPFSCVFLLSSAGITALSFS